MAKAEVVVEEVVLAMEAEEVVAAPSREDALMMMLEQNNKLLTDMASRVEKLENRPIIPVPSAGRMPMATNPQDALNLVTNPGSVKNGSSVLDPLMQYGFSHAFYDEQIVEVVDEGELKRLRDDVEGLRPGERMVGIVAHFTHRHPRTSIPKYRINFRDGIGTLNFWENQLEAYVG